jgi:hypothetical protein
VPEPDPLSVSVPVPAHALPLALSRGRSRSRVTGQPDCVASAMYFNALTMPPMQTSGCLASPDRAFRPFEIKLTFLYCRAVHVQSQVLSNE